jgi:hypothetical protein
MNCVTNHCLAQRLPSPSERLGKAQSLSTEFPAFGVHTVHEQKTLQKIEMFPDSVSGNGSGYPGDNRNAKRGENVHD